MLGPRRTANLKERTLEGAAVEAGTVTALEVAELKEDPPLLEEAVAALEGAKPENGAPLDEKGLVVLDSSLNQPKLAEPKRLPGVAAFCDVTLLEGTPDRLVDDGAPEEAVVEEEVVATRDGYGPKGLLEDSVRGCVAVLATGPKTPPESAILCGAEASENTLEGAAVEEEAVATLGVAEPKSDSPSEGTWTVLRGDGRCGTEVLEDPPKAAPEGAALGESAGAADAVEGDTPEGDASQENPWAAK